MQLKSQEMRKLAPELDPLRIGTGWKKEDLGKVQVMRQPSWKWTSEHSCGRGSQGNC